MTTPSSYFFQQDLQNHAQNPCNFGIKPGLDFISEQHNPSCGDRVTIAGSMNQKTITYLCFQGSGCVISLAMASKITESCKGMTLSDVLNLDEDFVQKTLGIELGINRMKCGLLPLMALKQGILAFAKP